MAQKDRKIQRKGGTRSCGYGNTQKHRGAGSRGGRGMAGSNKQKWSYVTKYMPDHFGRNGFKRPLKMLQEDKTINIGDINRMVNSGDIQATGKSYVIDLTAMGYDKKAYRDWETDRKSTRLNSSHSAKSRMPSSA